MKTKKNFSCTVEGCEKPHRARGFCSSHYYQKYNAKEFDIKNENFRNHPLYILWWQRKSNNLLCEAWLDIEIFIQGVSPKPDGDYFLLQIDGSKPFGPDNFRWQAHLKRKEGETNKDWWARKRAARIAANPAMESDRNLKRKFGLSRKQYDEKLKNQNYVCAICKQKEASFDGRTGSFRNLAVDHCHKSEGIRELLCNRCNTTLGKVDDSIELLKEMINYLEKHREN